MTFKVINIVININDNGLKTYKIIMSNSCLLKDHYIFRLKYFFVLIFVVFVADDPHFDIMFKMVLIFTDYFYRMFKMIIIFARSFSVTLFKSVTEPSIQYT